MEVKGVPALTRVLHANATIQDVIDLYQEQIDELYQQIICYRGMAKERKKLIKELEKLKKTKKRSEEVCGPCASGDHENCELVECDCK